MDEVQKLALETIQMNKQALVFAPNRAGAEKTAEDLSKLTNLQLPELEKEILKAASVPTKQCRRLSHCIRKGIAFHHAGLLEQQRSLIEDEFRKGTIKIICCTPTLAAGLSLPAFRVIIKSLKRYSSQWGMGWIPVLEYLQMAGRAGRPEYEQFGEAISIAKDETEKDEIYERYVCGQPEDISSKLAVEPVLRTYLLSLISSGIIRDEKTMKEFFAKTFWAHHFADVQKLELILKKMLALLCEWGFVDAGNVVKNGQESEFVAASCINNVSNSKNNIDDSKVRFKPLLLGKRVSELYLDPLTAKHLIDCLEHFNEIKFNKAKGTPFSLLQIISNTLEMRPLLRVKSKEEDYINDELVKHYNLLLEEEPSAYDLEYEQFMDSVKTALFFESWIDEKDEDFLLDKYDIRPGEIRVKIEVADWLLYACEELAKIKECKDAVREIRKLRIRVKYGVREELLPLLKLKGIGRIRARKLYSQGIKDVGDLKKANIITLTQLIGKATAESVKEQIDDAVEEVPQGKRKGQLSIMKKY
ncbi:MAG: helicase-related protein [Nanoarchaeota archaeon]